MKALRFFLITLICGLFLSEAVAQFSRAEKRYNNLQYADAIPLYIQVLKKDSSNILAWSHLADCYRLTNQIKEAEKCYSRIAGRSECPAIAKFHYAQMLLSNENQNRAKFWFKEYRIDDPNDKRAEDFITVLDNVEWLISDSNRYTVSKININSKDADFGAVPYKDGIIFSSSRQQKGVDSKRDSWTGNRYMNFYFAKGTEDRFDEPQLFAKPLQTKYNNGPICFNSNETEMFYTMNNIEETPDQSVQINKLKIFSIVLENGKFGATRPFPYNDDSYSCAHPVLSADGNYLYFSSDMPGGYGGMDLWVCEKMTEGWGKPVNLGPAINTKGTEIFPTVCSDGKIFFSSNGLGGMGGLDIFSASLVNGNYTAPENMRAPINSPDDDFSLFFDPIKRGGYFSSNREHQGYNDDIYAFVSNEIMLTGIITDKLTNQPLTNSSVRLYSNGRESGRFYTDKNGKFNVLVVPDKDYALVAENSKHTNDTTYVTTDKNSVKDGKISVQMTLGNILVKDDRFVMKNILYDYNKYNIRADAAKELDRVVAVLIENPKTKIELSSHTDCRADDNYNQSLSEKRARAAYKYLIKQGIDKDRVTYKGYGKKMLINQCDCGPGKTNRCNEEDHQANRRTEIKVLE